MARRKTGDLLSLGYRELLTHAEAAGQASEIRLADMSEVARTHSWTLFNILTQSVEGRALSVIMNSEPANGLQAWRMLVDAYEPRVGGRYTAMLMGVIGPQWGHIKEANVVEALDTWEIQVRRYEDQSKEKVTAATKCAVVMKHALGGIRTALRTSSSVIGSNYDLLKKAIKDYLQTGVEFDGRGQTSEASNPNDAGGSAPMDVGAVSWKSGKKGKDDKGKGTKGKYGKDKGKWSKGKSSKGNGSSKFQGACSYWGKWGHKKAECRNRERDKKGKGGASAVEEEKTTSAVQYQGLDNRGGWDPDEVIRIKNEAGKWPRIKYQDDPQDVAQVVAASRRGMPSSSAYREAPSSSRHREAWADAHDDADFTRDSEEEDDQDSWVSAVCKDPGTMMGSSNAIIHNRFILYDSGSDEHVCAPDFGGRGEEQASSVKLNAVSGDALAIIGERER